MGRPIERILVVEDEPMLRRSLVRCGRMWAACVEEAASVEEAVSKLATRPDLILLDVRLPDGTGDQVVQAALDGGVLPAVIVVSGEASPDEAFRLAHQGVRAFVPKPIDPEHLDRTVDAVLSQPPSVRPFVMAAVGHAPLKSMQSDVRRVMVEQALAMAGGSRSGAARLLRVSRQAIQHFLQVGHDAE